MRLTLGLTFAATIAAFPAFAAEPATVEGDAFEQLGIALDLGGRCENMRGFEYLYLAEAWERQDAKSAARDTANAASRAAAESSAGDLLQRQFAVHKALERHAESWRTKAASLGCEGGHNYLLKGFVESYKQLGAVMAIAMAYRTGDGATQSPLPPLTPDQIGVVRAFDGQAAALFGDKKAQFDAMLPQLAQERLASYPSYTPEATMSAILDDHQKAFAIFQLESFANNAGWTARGATIADGSPFGYRTMRLSKDGSPPLSLIATPASISINHDAWSKAVHTYLAVGVRPDGTVIAGLGGGDLGSAPATITMKAEAPGNPVKRTATGRLTTEGCPYFRCFAFPREAAAALVPGDVTAKVRFFAAPDAAAQAHAARLDGVDVEGIRLQATTRPR